LVTAVHSCEIGDDVLIAEYVVIRDQDHSTITRPISSAGFVSAPVRIGHDVWLGAKATILKGVTIGDGCVVGAHALVRSDAPRYSLVIGVPARARPLKMIPEADGQCSEEHHSYAGKDRT
jgi:acetyltransferase-like isoleucine patch superfamily enzyme